MGMLKNQNYGGEFDYSGERGINDSENNIEDFHIA
jgi:hypothetical protein